MGTVLPVIFSGVKTIILLGLFLYAIFGAILVRQEQLMAHVLEEGSEPILRILVYIHLIASLLIVGLAWILL